MEATTTNITEAINKIADFWVAECTGNKMNWNNGDDSQSGGLAFMMANLLAQSTRSTISNEQRELFRAAIVKNLESQIERSGGRHAQLSVDYSPDYPFNECFAAAKLDSSCAPCKSRTYINEGKAFGSVGYGVSVQEL